MRLVGGMTVCLYAFPALLAEVRRIHPALDLKITVGSAERSIAMLRSGAGDLGLLTLPVEASDLVSVPVLEEELLLITYPAHPLAQQAGDHPAPISTSSRSSCSKPDRSPGGSSRSSSPASTSKPQIVMETENVEIIKAMVRNGLGISIIPWQAAAADVRTKQLFCSRIAGHSLMRQTGWLYPKMSRLPRTVTEVLRIFETVRPRLDAAARPAAVAVEPYFVRRQRPQRVRRAMVDREPVAHFDLRSCGCA